MRTLTIGVSDERLEQLRLAISPEELARVGVEDLLARTGEDLRGAVDYVHRCLPGAS